MFYYLDYFIYLRKLNYTILYINIFVGREYSVIQCLRLYNTRSTWLENNTWCDQKVVTNVPKYSDDERVFGLHAKSKLYTIIVYSLESRTHMQIYRTDQLSHNRIYIYIYMYNSIIHFVGRASLELHIYVKFETV